MREEVSMHNHTSLFVFLALGFALSLATHYLGIYMFSQRGSLKKVGLLLVDIALFLFSAAVFIFFGANVSSVSHEDEIQLAEQYQKAAETACSLSGCSVALETDPVTGEYDIVVRSKDRKLEFVIPPHGKVGMIPFP